MKISILGAGNVGGALRIAWARKGHEVFFGVPRPQDAKTQEVLKTIGSKARAGSVAEAATGCNWLRTSASSPSTRADSWSRGCWSRMPCCGFTSPSRGLGRDFAFGLLKRE